MTKKPTIICIGAATQDVFLKGEIFAPHRDEDGYVEEFKLGSKNNVDEIVFSTGGGATNGAVTFVRQGMRALYIGKTAEDSAGQAVRHSLQQEGVDVSLVGTTDKYSTDYSVLLLAPSGERTILTYRGASAHYELDSRDFHEKNADWFYITSLGGNYKVLETAMDYAEKHNIKVAINPGKKELAKPDRLLPILKKCTILSLNKEELAMIFKGKTLEELVKSAGQTVQYVVGTDGPHGCIATDGQNLYKAGLYKDVKVIDRTGAGDAFCSGFTAMVIRGESIEDAITFASANSTSVVQYIGAKEGILKNHAKLESMKITIEEL